MNSLYAWFRNLDEAQRKTVLLGAGVVVAVGVVMFPSTSTLRHMFVSTPQVQPRRPAPFPPFYAPPIPAPVSVPPPPPFASVIGNWQGQATIPERGICTLQIEMREQSQQPGTIAGYSTLVCKTLPNPFPFGQTRNYTDAVKAMTDMVKTTSAILSGTWENGSVRFHVDKNIGINQADSACLLASFTVTGFGINQIVSEFQDSCGTGQIILRKTHA